MQVRHFVCLDQVHHIPEQGAGLEGLEHLRPGEEGHVPLPQRGDQAVRLGEVVQVQVGALLGLVQHHEELRDLLDDRWHRVAGLLRLVEELVDLQLLQQVGLCRLDHDGPLPTSLVKDILAFDVLQLTLILLHVAGGGGNRLLQLVYLVADLGVLGRQRVRAVASLLDLRFHGVLLLVLGVNPTCQVSILCLELANFLVHLRYFSLGLLLCLLRHGHRLLDLLVFLLQHVGLLLRLLALLLSQNLCISLHRDLCLEVLALPLQRVEFFVPCNIFGLLLFQLHLIKSQRIHQRIHLVMILAAPFLRATVLLLQLLVCTLRLGQRLL
mmetsp:Transcript_13809/g.39290  ORF Transcript_13809/g.39290 Transcript_13809/m.39290 type:complete len:325 (-) Transcript_13809:909-1883(-)